MANNTHELKSRLKSIQSTQKITKAMQLVAVSKLQKIKSAYLKNRNYSQGLRDIMIEVLSYNASIEHPMLQQPKIDDKPYYIVFSSDLGLAGGYSTNLFKYIHENNMKQAQLHWIGKKGYTRFKAEGYKISNESVILGDKIIYEDIHKLGVKVIEKFKHHEITSINVLYTNYVNATTYEVVAQKVLPVTLDERKMEFKEIIYNPSAQEILDNLVPRYVISEIYQYYMSSKTSEYSSRRVSMESATDNAQELIDDLRLEYNKVRQQAITQEITEIISGTIGG